MVVHPRAAAGVGLAAIAHHAHAIMERRRALISMQMYQDLNLLSYHQLRIHLISASFPASAMIHLNAAAHESEGCEKCSYLP